MNHKLTKKIIIILAILSFEEEGYDKLPSYDTVKAGDLRKSSYVMIKKIPCKITNVSYKQTKKGRQVTFIGKDIFTGKTFEDNALQTQILKVPVVERHEYKITSIDSDGIVSRVMKDGTVDQTLKLPQDPKIHEQLQNMYYDNKKSDKLYFATLSFQGRQIFVYGKLKEQ